MEQVECKVYEIKQCPTCGAFHKRRSDYCINCRPNAYKHIDYENATHKCKRCGATVVGGKSHRLCKACKDKASRESKHKGCTQHRARVITRETGAEYEPGITLEKVYERDGGVCWICGKPTDTSDRRWGPCGPNYPSVDHVIPLAKGGSHTWANVRLAHHKCNSVKSDHLIESA